MKRIALYTIIACSVGAFLFFANSSYTVSSKSGVDWLPIDANNITYQIERNWLKKETTAVFEISENHFANYAQSQGWKIEEKSSFDFIYTRSLLKNRTPPRGTVLLHKNIDEEGNGICIAYNPASSTAHYYRSN